MTSNTKRKEESHQLNGGVKQPTWSKAFNSNAVWEDKVSQLPFSAFSRSLILFQLLIATPKLSDPYFLQGVFKNG